MSLGTRGHGLVKVFGRGAGRVAARFFTHYYAWGMIGPASGGAWSKLFLEVASRHGPTRDLMRRCESMGGLSRVDAESVIQGFRDDCGNRQAVDEALLRHVLHRAMGNAAAASAGDAVMMTAGVWVPAQTELQCWCGVGEGEGWCAGGGGGGDVGGGVGGGATRWLAERYSGEILKTHPSSSRESFGLPVGDEARVEDVFPSDGRSLAHEAREESLETWTESELCCLHALSWMPEYSRRVRAAASWLIETLQPDNATNHPWGVHVFATLGGEDADANMYAQTLLHNALVGGGRGGVPDARSAFILWDAALWLQVGPREGLRTT